MRAVFLWMLVLAQPALAEDELDLFGLSEEQTKEEDKKKEPEKPESKSNEGVFDFGSDEVAEATAAIEVGLEQRRRFQAALKLSADNQHEAAAMEFAAFVTSPDDAFKAFQQESEYQLAKSLYALGLWQAALARFQGILSQGPTHTRYRKAVEWLFPLSERVADQTPILVELSRFSNVKFPKAYAEQYSFLLAKRLFEQARQMMETEPVAESPGGMDFGGGGNEATSQAESPEATIARAIELLRGIAKDSDFYARGRYLEATLHYLAGRPQDAVAGYQEVVRALNPKLVGKEQGHIRELALLSLGRIHYGAEQFDKSVFYYERIPRGSPHWLAALFEASWAYYRRGDFERALGHLLTLHSPVFAGAYFPESFVVKAIIYFEACRYREAREMIDDFLDKYTRLLKEIENVIASESAVAELYEEWGTLQYSQEPDKALMAKVVGAAILDVQVQQAWDAVTAVGRQLKGLESLSDTMLGAPLGQQIFDELKGLAALRTQEAIRVSRERLTREKDALREILAQALRVKLEVSRSERLVVEQQLQGQKTEEVAARERTWESGDDRLIWPFDGELWADELGTYEISFASCARKDSEQ